MSLARAWTRLFVRESLNRCLAAGFYASQLGRYIPGAIWQPLAQVGLATQAGASLQQASTGFGVFALVEVAAGGTVGATLAVLGRGLPLAVRLSALLMLVPMLVLRRGWIVRTLHMVTRLTRKRFGGGIVPSQRAILSSYCWTLVTLVLNSAAFTVLLSSFRGGAPILRSAAAFGFAWTIGFLAIPFPSGIGIREAILILALRSAVPTSYVIAASVTHRLVSMVGELLMIISSRIVLRSRLSQSARADRMKQTT